MNPNNENTKLGSGIYYTEKDKEFLAAYFNQAIHNVFIVFNHIAKRLGFDELSSDDELKNWLIGRKNEKKRNAIDRQRFLEMIDQHFPFLRIANADRKDAKRENDLEDNLDLLIFMLDELFERRNEYSHAIVHATANENDRELNWRLNSIYDANINLVKRDFFESNVHNEVNKDPYEKHFEHLRRFCENKDKSILDENGKKKRSVPNPRFRTPLIDSTTQHLTIYGLVFFVSLFLEKKYAILMQKNVAGLKDARETSFKMTNEVFCRTRIGMPRVRLHSTKSADALVLDMLNELGKAPEPFFEQLTDEYKTKFFIETNDSEEQDDLFTLAKTTRKQNRFPYFALRYLDEIEAFKSLRFQIDLGNYHFHLYESKINNATESRHLTRKLFGFGRLTDFEPEHAPQEWKDLSKDLDYYEGAEQPFIAKTYPHYHLEENKIGIRIVTQEENRWPHLLDNPLESFPKYKRNENEKADAFLSGNELLAAAFCHHLYSKSGKPDFVEETIQKKYRSLKRVFSDLKSGKLQEQLAGNTSNEAIAQMLADTYKLALDEVPLRLLTHLNQQEPRDIKKHALEKLELLIAQTGKRIERFKLTKVSEVKVGKAQYRTLRAGDMADWLVRDFMQFQPIGQKRNAEGKLEPDLKSKANPKKYQLLQKSLALYGQEKDNLIGLFRSCNLVSSPNEHPFLGELVQRMPETWQEFYENYLNARLSYLNKCREKGIKKNSYQAYYSFLKIKPKLNNKENLHKGWDMQIHLPTNMFIAAIHDWFRDSANEPLRMWFAQQEKPQQLIGLIRKYLELENNDQIQSFYDSFPLRYDFYKKEFPKGLTLSERIDKQKAIWENKLIVTKTRLEKAAQELKLAKKNADSLTNLTRRFSDGDTAKITLSKTFDPFIVNKVVEKIQERDKPLFADTIIEKILMKYEANRFEIEQEIRDFKTMLTTEKYIRRVKAEDCVTLWMLSDLMKKNQIAIGQEQRTIQLKDIQPMGETEVQGILDQVQVLEQQLDYFACDDKGKISNVKLGEWIIYSSDTKVKKQGNFKQLVKDRRLNNLAQYILPSSPGTAVRVKRILLEKELELYDRNRIPIIKLMHDLERAVYAVFPFEKEVKYKQFRTYMDELKKEAKLNEVQCGHLNILVAIRNAIMHNQYPNRHQVTTITPFTCDDSAPAIEGLTIARQMLECAQASVAEILKCIPKS